MNTLAEFFWGQKSKFLYLFIASIILLLGFLGAREIWTQEHRWADIVSGMFFRQDFLHPYLNTVSYYDKPLLSYWLIAAFTFITGHLSTWTLRLPSALAGLLAIGSIYRLGCQLKNKQLGLLAGWMLLTTFYFLFWARTSSADMLNMAGSLFAVCWYAEKKSQPNFFNYSIFFLILAITGLCKGLVGIIVPLIAIFPDILRQKEWKRYFQITFFLSMVPAVIVYIFPFLASAHFGGDHYEQSGLYLVYRENILRFFQPFDHKGPIYTYFIFLPIYLLPWTVFFIPALFSLKTRWKHLSPHSKWMVWSVLLLFLFFTVSGSRRNYYVLPLIPFAILMTADWILEWKTKSILWVGRFAGLSFLALFIHFIVSQPLYYRKGLPDFASQLKHQATEVKPWSEWKFVMLDPESKSRFYLQLAPFVKELKVQGHRDQQTISSLLTVWPMLKNKDSNVIFISRKIYEPLLKTLLPTYRVVEEKSSFVKHIFSVDDTNNTIAFVPMA